MHNNTTFTKWYDLNFYTIGQTKLFEKLNRVLFFREEIYCLIWYYWDISLIRKSKISCYRINSVDSLIIRDSNKIIWFYNIKKLYN